MSDALHDSPHDSLGEPAGDPRTGDAGVDAVLDRLAELDGRPVDEHVQVFERAHDDLRRALDATPQTGSGTP